MINSMYGPARVFHIREIDFEGKVTNTGGATYVFAKVPEKGWIYSTAYCSHKDNFCRKIGREIARGRMEKGSFHKWDNNHQIPTYQEVERKYLTHMFHELRAQDYA